MILKQLILQIVLKLFMDIFSAVGIEMLSSLHSAFVLAINMVNRSIKIF